MNKNIVIANIALIADAAEYFDRKVGSAWKIRSTITNALVWAANSLIKISKDGNKEQIDRAKAVLATLRTWAKDVDTSGLFLDLTHGNVRKTLGLDRQVDAHEEACRVARNKCILARSSVQFKKFYDTARSSLEEQQRQREEAVEEIVNLLSDSGFGDATDADLYDEAMVETQFDNLCERLANVLESMHIVCDAELAAAIVTNKISRLTGYLNAIESMMDIIGVDKSKLARRQLALENAMKAAEQEILADVKSIDTDIEGEITKMMIDQEAAKVEPPKAPIRRMVKKTDAEKFNDALKRATVANLRIMLTVDHTEEQLEAIRDELDSRGVTIE